MSFRQTSARLALLLLVLCTAFSPALAHAQIGGQGAISGSVTDSTGALVPKATVTARNVATNISTTRTTSSDGLYNISPLLPGTYSVTVSSAGFQTFTQENLVVDALTNLGFNVQLKPGSESQTITVTDAPPLLDTTSPTLGGVIENSTYTALPIMISGLQQRDVTQFSNLLPGAQVNPGGRSSIIGGTGQRLGELYVDGLPLTTVSQQGDNRPVFNIVPLEAIDQIKVVTSGFSAEYQGAGLENYNLKSGTNKYHGAIFAYFRNTAFDAWSFASKPGGGNTLRVVDPVTGAVTTPPGPKPAEHQDELGFAVGGPVKIPFLFNGHDKLFFYATYDKFRSRQASNPSAMTLPTTLMKQGNFQELLPVNATTGGKGNTAGANYPIYDPTTQASCTSHSTNGPCRYQFGYGPGATNGAAGNPVLLSPGQANIIPASKLSPITQYMQKFMPTPSIDTVGFIQNNHLAGVPTGYDNWLYSGRIDYNISSRQTLSLSLTGGNRHAIPYTSVSAPPLPIPYYNSTISIVAGHWADLEHTFTITPHLINQFKFGFMNFGGPPVKNIGAGDPQYGFGASGVKGLPVGQATDDFPNLAFTGNNIPTSPWAGNTQTTTSVSETFTALDNIQWLKGKHSMNFGGQYQWLQNNASANGFDTASGQVGLTFNTNSTANLATATTYQTNSGYSYASFLLGAVGSSPNITQQTLGLVGSRFHPFAVYFQDDFKATPNLVLNLGLRWDDLPTYREAQDRWSFLNPNITNPVTGNAGALQFAGNRGAGISCECSTPVNTYYKNFGPRVGFAYTVAEKTVFRGGFGILYSHAGGTGGAGGAGVGTGQVGFSSGGTAFADSFSGPAFYLNSNPAFSAPNANWGGPTYVLPPVAPITATSQATSTGYYVCSGQAFAPCNGATGTSAGNGSSIAFADPYLSGRAPVFNFYNFAIQREITNDLTVSVNYAGSQSHFIAGAGGIRGLYAGQLDPKYLALRQYLPMAANQANINAAQAATGISLAVPYAGYVAAAAVNPGNATIAHMLTWKPQYSSTTDTWGTNVANASYNAFQLSVAKRLSHGLSFNINYTYSHNIDDAGTQRSGYDIPAFAIADGQFHPKNRIDRSLSINSQPQNLSIYGVYQLPFGKGAIGGDHFITRALFGGWMFSSIYQYSSGIPLALTGSCAGTLTVGQGTCMPDYNPNFVGKGGSVRTNGKWGQGVTAATIGSKSYLAGGLPATNTPGQGLGGVPCASSTGPYCDSNFYTIGDLPRVAPYGLRGPDLYRLTSSVRRTFDITERAKFIFAVDCQNVTNHTTFGSNASNQTTIVNVDSATFGTLQFSSADSRAFQFSGRFTF